jgi:hypothetical protein
MRGVSFGGDPTALLTANQQIFIHRFGFSFTIPADFGDYAGASTTFGGTAAATADVVLRIQRAAATSPLTFAAAGTITIGAGGVDVIAHDSSGIDIVFAKRDIIRILAPTSPDAGLKGVYGTVIGYQP